MSPGTLFVVGTPLGHLGDLSGRAREVLGAADVIAAEDTRRARSLLSQVPSRARVMSYHAHSPPSRLRAILTVLDEGAGVALVTDAGTPTVSDPGAELVRRARAAGHRVVPVPGPSAVTAAISASGLPGDRYIFLGFMPRRGRDRRRLLDQAARSPWTVVIFESALRLGALLNDLAVACGADRAAVVARELTKVYEDVRSGTLSHLADHFGALPARGEVTVVVGGAPPESPATTQATEAAAAAREWLAGGASRRDVVARVARKFGIPRNEAYRMVTAL